MTSSASSRFASLPIRRQLLIIIFLLMLPIISFLIYLGMEHRRTAIMAATTATGEMADRIAGEIRQLVAGSQQLASALSQLHDVRNPNPAAVQPLLARILRLNPQYVNIAITDHNGAIWVSGRSVAMPCSVADRQYFRNASATGEFSSGEYAVGRVTGKPTLGFSHPLFDVSGEFNGIISITLEINNFCDLPAQSEFPPRTSIVLLDHRGTILSRTLNNTMYRGKPFQKKLFERIVNEGDRSTFRAFGIDGIERFSSHRKLRLAGETTPDLYIRAGISIHDALAETNRILLMSSMVSILAIVVAFGCAWLIGKRSVVDCVNALEVASRRVAEGDLQVRVADTVSGGELGRLAKTFDFMAQRLAQREQDMNQAREALLASRNMLQQLNHRLETARELERKHLAREIHDVMGQSLTALMLNVTWMIEHSALQTADSLDRATEILNLIDTLTNVVHSITAELSPPLLEQGLAAAIEWHAREFERRSGISCVTMLDERSSLLLNNEVETLLFRIVQEALTNVVRHAGASEISISLCTAQGAVILEVADNGTGIVEESISSPIAFGLLGMRQRAQMCGATFTILGASGRGTIVKLEVPTAKETSL